MGMNKSAVTTAAAATIFSGVLVAISLAAFGPLLATSTSTSTAAPETAKVASIFELNGFADAPEKVEPVVAAPVVVAEPAPVVEAPAPVVEEPVYVEEYVEPAPVEEASSGLLPSGAVPPPSADGPFPDSSFCASQALTWNGVESVCG